VLGGPWSSWTSRPIHRVASTNKLSWKLLHQNVSNICSSYRAWTQFSIFLSRIPNSSSASNPWPQKVAVQYSIGIHAIQSMRVLLPRISGDGQPAIINKALWVSCLLIFSLYAFLAIYASLGSEMERAGKYFGDSSRWHGTRQWINGDRNARITLLLKHSIIGRSGSCPNVEFDSAFPLNAGR
jgi:hypothetical protein